MNTVYFLLLAYLAGEIPITTESSRLLLREQQSFGHSILWEVDLIVAGSIRANTSNAIQTGATYFFEKQDQQWVQIDKIWPSDVERGDFFGYSLSKNDTQLVIGAPQNREGEDFTGAVYVFNKSGKNWVESEKIVPENPGSREFFGSDVHLDNDTILAVGRQGVYEFKFQNGVWEEVDLHTSDEEIKRFFSFEAEDDLMVAPDQADSSIVAGNGAAHVFERQDGNWAKVDVLYPSGEQEAINFGYSSAISGDRFAIGAIRSHFNGPESGSVFIFEKINGSWVETSIVHPLNPEDHMFFGFSLYLKDDKLLVGAPGNAIEEANSYVFEFHLIDSQWEQTAIYQSEGVELNDRFGAKVIQSKNEVLVTSTGAYDDFEEAWAAYFFESDYIYASSFD